MDTACSARVHHLLARRQPELAGAVLVLACLVAHRPPSDGGELS